ncbi:hypothetical protein B7463_g10081, partial [Scytalidium lignicola]
MEHEKDLNTVLDALTLRENGVSNRSYYQLSMDFGTANSAAVARFVQYISNSHSQNSGETGKYVYHDSFVIDRYPGPENSKTLTEEGRSTVAFQGQHVVDWNCEREDFDDDGVFFFELIKMVFDETEQGRDMKMRVLNQCGSASLTHINMISGYLRKWYEFCVYRIEEITNDPNPKTIQAIFSAPASWTSLAKQELRDAARQAGIKLKEGDIHPEPQAVAAFLLNTDQGLHVEIGDVIIVLDAGGGTSDIALLQIESLNPLQVSQLAPIDGDTLGSVLLDETFEKRLRLKLRNVNYITASNMEKRIRMAVTHFKINSKTKYGIGSSREIFIPFKGLRPDPENNLREGQVFFSRSECSSIFDPIAEGNIDLVVKQLETYRSITKREGKQEKMVKYLFFVGGLSGSPYMKHAIRNAFEVDEILGYRVQVKTPNKDGAIAVAQGALLLSSNKSTIKHIRFPCGYAIVHDEKWNKDDHGKHAEKYRDPRDNCLWAKDRVEVLIQKEDRATYTQATPYVKRSVKCYFDQDIDGPLEFKVPIWRCLNRVPQHADLRAVKETKGITLAYDLHIDLSDAIDAGVLSYNAGGKKGVQPFSEYLRDRPVPLTVWQNTRSAHLPSNLLVELSNHEPSGANEGAITRPRRANINQDCSFDRSDGVDSTASTNGNTAEIATSDTYPTVKTFYRFWYQVVAKYVGSELIFEIEVPPGGKVRGRKTLKLAEQDQGE